MPIDLTNKKIIMIHGLASKPPRNETHQLWRQTLTENIRVSHRRLAGKLDTHPEVFESAYWADVVPHHIPDDRGYIKKLQVMLKEEEDESIIPLILKALDRLGAPDIKELALPYLSHPLETVRLAALDTFEIKSDDTARKLNPFPPCSFSRGSTGRKKSASIP